MINYKINFVILTLRLMMIMTQLINIKIDNLRQVNFNKINLKLSLKKREQEQFRSYYC